jgi:hypothetical protein
MKCLRLILPILFLTAPLFAQQENGAELTIHFVGESSRFRVGEVIPIELSFTASTPDSFEMTTRNYDRSGRLNIEKFNVSPPGRDPLKKYYSEGSFMMGGAGITQTLSADPQEMREDLNEWVALDEPGHYSLYVTSGRVSRRDAAKNEPIELRSNFLEFDIVDADPGWQQRTLKTALATLNMESSTREEKNSASQALRFLDSPDSVRELVGLLGSHAEGPHWNEVAGLAGSRNQNLVVSELERQMSAPDIGIGRDYVYILAKLKFQLDHEPLPPYPQKDKEQQKIWSERRQANDKKLNELQDTLYDRAASLVSSKNGIARADTVQTVLLRPSRDSSAAKPLGALPPEEIASAFLNLSQEQQWDLLSSFWERLKISAMVGPLKKVVEQPEMKQQRLRDVALRRFYDLDPSVAAPIFLEEIRQPHFDSSVFPSVRIETLGLLPNETLPQFDEMLSARLEEKESRTRGLDAQLVGRFSTKAILKKVKSVYETLPGQWDCLTEDGFVVYFLRVDTDYGVKRLAVAPSACMNNSLPIVVRMHRWSEVEPGIIARLNGPDPWRARQAAEALARYGSPKAEGALWDRLSRFHEQWMERGNELTYRGEMKHDANEALSFQFGLVEAIGHAQAWLLTDEKIDDLERLTLGQERDNVKSWHWSSPVDVNISLFGEQMHAWVGQYSPSDLASLRSKLAQYPAGTKFRLNVSGSPERVDPVIAELNDIAAEYGFEVVRP